MKKAAKKKPAPKKQPKKAAPAPKPVTKKKGKEPPTEAPSFLEPEPPIDEREPWTQPEFTTQHDDLICEYCQQPIHCMMAPVVLEWGTNKDKKDRPQWMGRPIKRAAHLQCDREHRGIKQTEKKESNRKAPAGEKAPKEPKQPRKQSSSDTQVIVKLRDDNPRKQGTHGWNSWELIKKGMTVAEYLEAGGRRNDLAWDVDHHWIELK